MNRIINIFTYNALIAYCFVVFALAYDLSLSNLSFKAMLPYAVHTFTTFAMLVLFLGLIRIHRRWQGTRDMKNFRTFIFTTYIAKTHRRQGIVITSIEILFFVAAIIFCTRIMEHYPEYVVPMISVLTLISVESLIFIVRLARGGESFRLGFNKDILAYYDREMHLFYYNGLLRVELNQKDLLNFGYRDDLNLALATDAIPKADRKAFRDALIRVLEEKNVYIDDSFRNWE